MGFEEDCLEDDLIDMLWSAECCCFAVESKNMYPFTRVLDTG